MNKKIIFFDIDGTIMGEESKKILPSTADAIKKARENGHLAVINTGRTTFLIGSKIRKQIGFDGYLAGCGTNVCFDGKELMHKSLSAKLTQKLIKELRSCKIDGVLEGKEKDYIDYPENMHTEGFKNFVEGQKVRHGYWEDEDVKADKLFVYADENSDMERFQETFAEEFDFIDREYGYWEIVPRGCSKATAIQYLIDYLGMPIEDTVAIGDSNNDISMLSYVNTSIAMGNSTQAVLEMADYITAHVDEDGIEQALKWLKVI